MNPHHAASRRCSTPDRSRPQPRAGSTRRWLQRCSVGLLIGLASTAAGAAPPPRDWPSVPLPKGAESFWVAPHIVHNSVPMQIKAFNAEQSVEEVRRFYAHWFADKRGHSVTQRGDAQILGARVGLYQVIVELRSGTDAKGTAGRISSAALYEPGPRMGEAQAAKPGMGIPRPSNSEQLSQTLSFDPGSSNQTTVLRNRISVESNALYLREQLILQGWALMSDQTKIGGRQSVLVFRRPSEELVVTLNWEHPHCYVIASQTRHEQE